MNHGELAIQAEGLHKHFGAVHALDDVSFTVPAGTVVGLLGPNGAGKTTAVRILTTLLRPDAGRARVAGFDVVNQAPQVRAAVGLAGQQAAVDPLLTGRENLALIATLHHLGRRETRRRVHELLERFDLTDAAGRRASTYSGGMRRRLDLAASLIGQPQVLVLDEPTSGLDPASRQALWATIRSLVDQGTTALLTTQYLEEADHLADDIVVIDHGQLVAHGTPDQLKAKVGGHRIELRLTDRSDTDAAALALEDLANRPPMIDADAGRLVIPITGGAAPTAAIIRALDTTGIDVADIVVRHPTLDDVFLTLTGTGIGTTSTGTGTTGQADPVAIAGGAP
jgi:ABC-2 type transport system ATP-binding protein